MKRILAFFCVLALSCTLVACSGREATNVTYASFATALADCGATLHSTEQENGTVIHCSLVGVKDVEIELLRGKKDGIKKDSIHTIEIVYKNAKLSLIESETRINDVILGNKEEFTKDDSEIVQYYSYLKILADIVAGEHVEASTVIEMLAGKQPKQYGKWSVSVVKNASASTLTLRADYQP